MSSSDLKSTVGGMLAALEGVAVGEDAILEGRRCVRERGVCRALGPSWKLVWENVARPRLVEEATTYLVVGK